MRNNRTPLFSALISLALGSTLVACGAPVEPSEAASLGAVEQSIILPEDCPPYTPPCECELKGTYACRDNDGDGVVNMDDNCVSMSNPDQTDCDRDGTGDVCDSLNGTQTTRNYSIFVSSGYANYYQYCYWNQAYYQMYYNYNNYQEVTTTYCSGGTSTTTNYVGNSTYYCYQYAGYCFYNNTSFMPTPWC